MGDLSQHFSRQEFACHCGCGEDQVSPALVEALEQLRAAAGNVPVSIISGRRCLRHNAQVGGSKDSQHLQGRAADLVIHGLPLEALFDLAAGVPMFRNGGIGLYPGQGFIHVDVRGHAARWGQVGGRYVSIAEALRHV